MAVAGNSTKVYSGFDPRLLAPMYLWYDSADVSTVILSGSTANVSQWLDKSGNNYHARGVDATNGITQRPQWALGTASLNSISTMSMNANANGAYFRTGFQMPPAGTFTTIMLARNPTTSTALPTCFYSVNTLSQTASTNLVAFYSATVSLGGLNQLLWRFGGRGGLVSGISLDTRPGFSISAGWFIHAGAWAPTYAEHYYNETISGRQGWGVRGNGATIAANTTSNLPLSLTASGQVVLGGVYTSTDINVDLFARGGAIAEFMMYEGILTDLQRQAAEWYLVNKWGLSLSFIAFGNLSGPIFPYTPTNPPRLRPFHPLDINGLARWYDAADRNTFVLSTNPTRILSWVDKSQNDTGFSLSTAKSFFPIGGVATATYGTGTLGNSWPTVTLANATFTETNSVTYRGNMQTTFLYANTTTGAFSFFRNLSSGGGAASISGLVVGFTANNTVNAFVSNYTPSGNILSAVGARPRLAAGQLTMSRVNLYESGTTISEFAGIGGSNAQQDARFAIAATGNTEIGEILVYAGPMGNGHREQVEGYLAWKWNAVSNLPVTHPYKYFRPYTIAWSPLVYSKFPTYWFDAADQTTITRNVTNRVLTWRNKGSFAGIASYNTGTVQTTSTSLNNLGVITFGISSSLSGRSGYDGLDTLSARSYAIVARITGSLATNRARIFTRDYFSGGEIFHISRLATASYGIIFNASGRNTPTSASVSTGDLSTAGFFIATLTTICDNQWNTVRWNGTTLSARIGVTPSISTGVANSNLVYIIGGGNAPGTFFTNVSFDLCELLEFRTQLSSQELTRLEGYFAWKWGLRTNLPNDHPFKAVPP
jgi:hypothetical protein